MHRVFLFLAASVVALACRSPLDDGPQNVVFVTVDTLRADHVGSYGYPLETTPFVDSLAERGVVFENAFSSSSHTAPSHASMLTSLYPEAHGVLRNGAALNAERIDTLAELLSGRGFTTALFTSVGFLTEVAAGFGEVDAVFSTEEPGYRRAADTVAAAIDWLESRQADRRVFMMLHVFDVHEHGPGAEPPPRFERRIRREMRRHADVAERHIEHVGPPAGKAAGLLRHLRRYDAQLAYVDRQIASLYVAFEEQRPGQDTLWIITSDHGEGLGEHGLLGHGRHLYNEQLRVPLIFHRTQGASTGTRVGQLVRLVDIFPTILELVGAAGERTEQRIEGVSLVPLLESPDAELALEYVYAQRRPIDDERRLSRWEEGLVIAAQNLEEKYIYFESRPPEYYDLTEDPRELVNLVEERPMQADRLRRWLLGRYSEMRSSRPDSSGEALPRYLNELEALGYVD